MRLPAAKVCLALALALSAPAAGAEEVYQRPEEFLAEAFAGEAPAPAMLWITRDLEPEVERILGHRLGALRVRYWRRGARTAWILDEIGKYRPITTGLVVDGGRIERVRVLIYRESRGWEVRYPAFTDQFVGAGRRGRRLDRSIDGISGATLSVDALTRLAALALFLHERAVAADG